VLREESIPVALCPPHISHR